MRIATFNVNGVNGRLPVLLRWLEETAPDVVCLQELKSETFPQGAIRAAGYEAVWQGQKSWNGVAILARGKTPIETRRGLPGDAGDTHSRYIEAAVDGLLIGCLYVPNGNPAPGEKFDFKLRWFERLIAHAAELLATGAPVALVGDYNVMPTELDVYKPERWVNDALFRVEVREAFRRLVGQGWTDALRTLHPGERISTFWDYFRNAYARDAGLRIDHLLWSRSLAARLKLAGVDRAAIGLEKRAITPRSGSSLRTGQCGAAMKSLIERPLLRILSAASDGRPSRGQTNALVKAGGQNRWNCFFLEPPTGAGQGRPAHPDSFSHLQERRHKHRPFAA
jgi:exodeoxyribonuclease III